MAPKSKPSAPSSAIAKIKAQLEAKKKAEEEANIIKRDYDSAASAYTTLRSLLEHNA